MNTLTSAFLIQLVLCAILFAMLFYLITANAKIKKEIESETGRLKYRAKV
jgi:hypothetical protein